MKYMMATDAFHQLGEISRRDPDLCVVISETETDYYGSWVFGIGFINVRFPKSTTRHLTDDEVAYYNEMDIHIIGSMSGDHSYTVHNAIKIE